MSQYDYKPEYKRYLPHIQPPGATLFVTIRLAGSIPKTVLRQLKTENEEREKAISQTAAQNDLPRLIYQEQKRQFARFDDLLDKATTGPFWLRQAEIAALVVDAIHYRDGKVYDLDAYCLMANHVHMVITPLEKEDNGWFPLQTIMHSFKRYTASEANNLLGRKGGFWQRESYDHVIRDRQEWERISKYVLNNPVKAGLVESWEDWPWLHLR